MEEPAARQLLTLLDGTRDRAALLAELAAAAGVELEPDALDASLADLGALGAAARVACSADVAPARDPAAPAAARLPPDHARGRGRRSPSWAGCGSGLAHLHILHTSASLTLNENASPDVRDDFAAWFDRAVPEDAPYWTHTVEGPDDMPAHIKASLLGPSLTLPVRDGRFALGTWQGIYLCEHRDRGGARSLIVTL